MNTIDKKSLTLPVDMVKIIFKKLVFIGLLLLSSQVNACDVCGCSFMGPNLGILPQFQKNFLGLHYSYRSFASEHTNSEIGTKYTSQELFQTMELRGRFHLNQKIQLFLFLPFNINQQKENNLTNIFHGLGDITSLVNYSLYNNGDNVNKNWKHNFQLGGGIKFPIGNYNKLDKNNILNPNIQTGTGSIDFLVDAIYTVRYRNWGLNNSAFYRFNNNNSNDFKFGDRFTLSTSFFYWANIKGYSLLPNIGLNYDIAEKDVHNAFFVNQSGGNSVFTTYGLDFYYKKFTFGVNCQLPVFDNNPIIQNKLRFSATTLYNF